MASKLNRLTYVEDEADIRAIAEFALIEFGHYEIDVCESGAEALERAPDFRPDLILLDVMMPGMDGVETFKRLRAMRQFADTPIVFLTAKAMKHETNEYMMLGANGVIPKPFDPTVLSAQVQEIWDRATQTEHLS
jgi:two-component system, OmpR family, response regulator